MRTDGQRIECKCMGRLRTDGQRIGCKCMGRLRTCRDCGCGEANRTGFFAWFWVLKVFRGLVVVHVQYNLHASSRRVSIIPVLSVSMHVRRV